MKRKNQPLLCSLSFDEMAIRKHVQWCDKANEFLGYVTYGENTETVANNAIVFFLNGISTQIQLPIGYYFITSLSAEQRKVLLLEILFALHECDVIISNVTFDGLPANALMCELLGADLNSEDMKPYFIDPHSGRKIYIMLDPSHCEKLVRNNLAGSGTIWDTDNGRIEWDLFSKLVEFGNENPV